MASKNFVRVHTVYNHLPWAITTLVNSSRTIPEKVSKGMIIDMKKSMITPKHGIDYGGHVASAPGEAPAVEDAELYNSIQLVPVSKNEFGISAHEKGLILELGTVYIQPRPWIIPVVEKWRPTFVKEFEGLFANLPRGTGSASRRR